jgi:hypothetical protein
VIVAPAVQATRQTAVRKQADRVFSRDNSVNGERRSFALLRPATGDLSAQDPIRDAILEAYSRFEVQS